jgi:RNA polymerase sigma-70 factor (ECF subfamily)
MKATSFRWRPADPEELCFEAIRLMTLLVEHPGGRSSRRTRPARADALSMRRVSRPSGSVAGISCGFRSKDRAELDEDLISRGMWHLSHSAAGEEFSEYHLQAGIAACHCSAPDYDATDWPQILSLYDRLVEIDHSPVVALNRAIAVANVGGPAAGVQAVEAIRDRAKLESYHLLYAVLAEFEARLGNCRAAAEHYEAALERTETSSERAFLAKRLEECRASA